MCGWYCLRTASFALWWKVWIFPSSRMDAMADSSYDKKALAPLTELFRKDKPDVVHTHASLTARMAAKKAGVPRIFHTNTVWKMSAEIH